MGRRHRARIITYRQPRDETQPAPKSVSLLTFISLLNVTIYFVSLNDSAGEITKVAKMLCETGRGLINIWNGYNQFWINQRGTSGNQRKCKIKGRIHYRVGKGSHTLPVHGGLNRWRKTSAKRDENFDVRTKAKSFPPRHLFQSFSWNRFNLNYMQIRPQPPTSI